MKKLLLMGLLMVMGLTFNSCALVDDATDEAVIVQYGTPYYSTAGVILYYEYGGYHYYPRLYRGYPRYYRYAPHVRPHRYEHGGRPRVWHDARPTRPRPNTPGGHFGGGPGGGHKPQRRH